MLKILIVDNNVLFREGLSNLLQRESGIEVVGEASTIRETLQKVQEVNPDLALLEMGLPDMEELNGISLLHARYPHLQIVMLSNHDTEDALLTALRCGARGYLAKNSSLSKLMAGIRAIERGEAVVPRALVGRVLEEFTRLATLSKEDELAILTPREAEVLREIGQGCSNQQISDHLNIAENTVKVHVHNLLDKLGLRNRRQAARFARSQATLIKEIPYASSVAAPRLNGHQ